MDIPLEIPSIQESEVPAEPAPIVSVHDMLIELHKGVIRQLQYKVVAGTATSADLALAWKVLQDNGVPLENLRKGAGSDKEPNETFIKNLPFQPRVHVG